VFEKQLRENLSEVLEPHTRAEITKVIKRHYFDELKQREITRQDIARLESEMWRISAAITSLAERQKEGNSFKPLVAALRGLGRPVDLDFTPEDVRQAITYREGVLQEMESAET
jgi:hypothetical protein